MSPLQCGLLVLAVAACAATVFADSEGGSEPQLIAYAAYDGSEKKFSVKILDTDDPEYALTLIPEGYIARAVYRNLINETGWAFLELTTNAAVEDELQARGAGVLEAYLSAPLLGMHARNVARPFCDGRKPLCDRIQQYLNNNANYLKTMIKRHAQNDAYWHQVRLFYTQQAALLEGYRLRRQEMGSLGELSMWDILWLNVQGDLEDLVTALDPEGTLSDGKSQMERGRVLGSGSCSALIKILPGQQDLYVSHDTWSSYETMLRMQKKYVLNYRVSPGRSELLAGRAMSFSSYPGVITSGDDFYVMSSGLVTLETTIGNGNKELWKFVKPDGQVAEGTRAMVANRLARSGRLWTQIFGKHNSGTYNNEWMVVDYKRFSKGRVAKSGLLWVLEQLPGHIVSEDLTEKLIRDSYFASYNTPYFKEIFNLSGNPSLVKKYGDWFSYENSPRAQIFRRDHSKVKDLKSMWSLMRSNDFKNDPLSACNCTPTHNGENAIAARSDLNPANGTYPWGALGHRNHGATDTKITTSSLAEDLRFLGESGPPHYSDSCEPFSWSKADFAATTPHEGLPDTWTFPPVTFVWAWNDKGN